MCLCLFPSPKLRIFVKRPHATCPTNSKGFDLKGHVQVPGTCSLKIIIVSYEMFVGKVTGISALYKGDLSLVCAGVFNVYVVPKCCSTIITFKKGDYKALWAF